MSGQHCPEEFKIEAVNQVTDRGHSTAGVADRIGVTSHCTPPKKESCLY